MSCADETTRKGGPRSRNGQNLGVADKRTAGRVGVDARAGARVWPACGARANLRSEVRHGCGLTADNERLTTTIIPASAGVYTTFAIGRASCCVPARNGRDSGARECARAAVRAWRGAAPKRGRNLRSEGGQTWVRADGRKCATHDNDTPGLRGRAHDVRDWQGALLRRARLACAQWT